MQMNELIEKRLKMYGKRQQITFPNNRRRPDHHCPPAKSLPNNKKANYGRISCSSRERQMQLNAAKEEPTKSAWWIKVGSE
jgi:hypothetical protein